MQRLSFKSLSTGVLLAGVVSMPASADWVTLSGSNIDIGYDDSQASLAAFGAPTLVGDLITFSPSNFKAAATNDNLDYEANTFNLKINLHDGYRIQSLSVSEGGDYVLWGAGSFVSVGGETRVFDTAQLPPGIVQPLVASGLGTVKASGDLQTTHWSASTFSNLSGAAYADTRQLSFSLQNLLAAYATASQLNNPSFALIEKKFVAIDVGVMSVSPVPEPETWAMMLIGVGLVGFRLRSRSKKAAATRLV